jgi:hypothetical protein
LARLIGAETREMEVTAVVLLVLLVSGAERGYGASISIIYDLYEDY